MNKQEYLKLDDILVGIKLDEYEKLDCSIRCYDKRISQLVNLYHPWYSLNNQMMGYEDACRTNFGAPDIGIKLCDTNLVDVDDHRKNHIERIIIPQLHPVPIATDVNSGISFILDSNHTLSNLYRKFLVTGQDAIIPIAELQGRNLEKVFYDFKVLNKDGFLSKEQK